MAVVVSDTTPLHYLVLIDRDSILEKLYGRVIIPPAVLGELSHKSAPAKIQTWVATESLKVRGTLGIVAEAARANLLNFVDTMKALQQSSMHLVRNSSQP